MSQHNSLRVDAVGAKHRNVLKRFEKVKKMQGQGKWGERKSVYNLPKIKSMKVKVKKSAAPKEEGEKPAAEKK